MWSPAPLQALREGLFDVYQRAMPRERKSAPVTIVQIDEASLEQHGQWPWPRTLLAELVARISEAKPAAIGLDLLFPEADRLSPAELARLVPLPGALAKELQTLPSNDARLAEAIRGRNVVLGVAGFEEREGQSFPPLVEFAGLISSVPEIDQAAASRGLISVAERQRVVRRAALVGRIDEALVPALSLELWRVATGARAFSIEPAPHGLLEVAFADVRVPVQRDGSMWLRYSPHDAARFLSAAEVLAGGASPELLRSKLVLIGVTGVGLLDYKATPLGEHVPGVELHAQLIEQIFDGAYLARPDWTLWLEVAFLALGGALLIAFVPAARVRASVSALVLAWLLLAVIGVIAFAKAGVLFDAAWPALGLGAGFAVMLAAALSEADRQRRALREAAARAAGELEAARRIQMGLLPAPAQFDAERAFTLSAIVQPARSVGGDFYDCFKVGPQRLFFVVGDVSDKGMPAALFMALCKATIKAAAVSCAGDPGAALERAAAEIGHDNPETFFATVFAGALNLETGMLRYCNAGHEPPYVCRASQLVRLPKATRPPVGMKDGFAYSSELLELNHGDWILLVTDGVTEAMNANGELYGTQRLQRVLESLRREVAPAQITAAVLDDVRRFVGDRSASDDLTLLALRFR